MNAWKDEDTDDGSEVPFKALTREQARELAAKDPYAVNPWRVIAVQAAVGVVVALVALLFTGRMEVFWSALYGALIVVLPSALLARGVGRLDGTGPLAGALGFLGWQAVKMVLSLALLLGAVRVVPNLNWPALLVAVVVCLQVNWLALLWRGRAKKNERR